MSAPSGFPALSAHAAVKRELLVRYLDNWAPAALHHARHATYAEVTHPVATPAGPGAAEAGRSAADDDSTAVAALRVFAEFPELLARHRVAVVVAAVPADRAPAVSARLASALAELGAPPGLTQHVTAASLVPAVRAAGALDAPLLAYLDATGGSAPAIDELAALGAARHAELLLAVDPGTGPAGAGARVRAALSDAGFRHLACVELVDAAGAGQLVAFATGTAKHLVAFKEAMWAVDEYAGVRYRDPGDPDGALLDISLRPPLGPLKRELLRHLARGPLTVAELRDFAVAHTVYRAADVPAAVTSLLGGGAVTRRPARGRLTAETMITPSQPG